MPQEASQAKKTHFRENPRIPNELIREHNIFRLIHSLEEKLHLNIFIFCLLEKHLVFLILNNLLSLNGIEKTENLIQFSIIERSNKARAPPSFLPRRIPQFSHQRLLVVSQSIQRGERDTKSLLSTPSVLPEAQPSTIPREKTAWGKTVSHSFLISFQTLVLKAPLKAQEGW